MVRSAETPTLPAPHLGAPRHSLGDVGPPVAELGLEAPEKLVLAVIKLALAAVATVVRWERARWEARSWWEGAYVKTRSCQEGRRGGGEEFVGVGTHKPC